MKNWRRNIQEEDKLRVSGLDKEALAERAKEEFNRQTSQFNLFQKQYYTDSLPNLCRSQQEIHKNLTACWKANLREYVKYLKTDNDVEHQAWIHKNLV